MNRKTARRIGIIIFIFIFLPAVSYFGLAEYYKKGFSYGTWINDVYCTGKTVEEVNAELLKTYSYDGITLYDAEGNSFWISAEDIGFVYDFREALKEYLDGQNPYLWVENLVSAQKRTLLPVISYDEGKLLELLESAPAFWGKAEEERQVFIQKTGIGYVLVNERKHALNKGKAREAVGRSLAASETELDLEKSGCYEDLSYTEAMKEELVRWKKIEEFQDCRIIYQFGEEQLPVDASVVCDWMAEDETGNFIYDADGNIQPDSAKIEKFVDELADEYDTVGKARHFKATRGETITVEGGTYGNKIDREAEKEYLKEAFAGKADEIHTPRYIQTGWKQGKDDIGNTYIEVDMTEQMMYYYFDGKMELETPIVTGNTGRRWGTPEGINYVYGKAINRILSGPGYAAHVNFWMPVKGNIGIHDAKWRSEYGGEIYKTAGSHGCINTPYEAMSKLYGMAEIGTPVVMFY